MGIKTSSLGLKKRIDRSLSDTFMRASIANAQDLIRRRRSDCYTELGHFEEWREQAEDIRSHVLENLDFYLEQFADNARKAGATVYFARDDHEAVEYAKTIFHLQRTSRRCSSNFRAFM
jgi:L-lactate dehydrogenase complex protein LldF